MVFLLKAIYLKCLNLVQTYFGEDDEDEEVQINSESAEQVRVFSYLKVRLCFFKNNCYLILFFFFSTTSTTARAPTTAT